MDIEWFQLEPPTNLKANGDSRGLSSGRSQVSWGSVADATGYEIQYECPPPTCTGSPWSQITTNETTLNNLSLNTLYTVKIRSKLGNHASDESEPVYTYPTNGVPLDRRVATIGFSGYWPTRVYDYTFCSDPVPATTTTTNATTTTLPTTTTIDIRSEIRNGIAIWQSVSNRMVNVNSAVGTCDDNENGFIDPNERIGNIVWIDTDDRTHDICRNLAAPACAKKRHTDGQLKSAWIVFSEALATAPPYTDCVNLYRAAVHEAGHALGFDGYHSSLSGSVMRDGYACDPHGYDIVAIKALYQSVS